MAKQLPGKFPCLHPECGSSDGRAKYEDNSSYCFVCQRYFKPGADSEDSDFEETQTASPTANLRPPKKGYQKLTVKEILTYPVRGFKERQIKKEVAEFYGVRVSYDSDGEIDIHYYPYENDAAFKIRKLPKEFEWVNKSQALFGKERFTGGGKRLIICEGEIDTMSVAQAYMHKYNRVYPVVGLSSSVMAEKSLLAAREWVRSFEEVVLMFDEDEAGDKARAAAIRVIGADKVKITKLPVNDANQLLLEKGFQEVLRTIYDAEEYTPAGIIGKEDLWDALVNYNQIESLPYPACMEGVNEKVKGMRPGEISLFISGTGSGKSTLLREIMLHLIETTPDAKIGIISLEESPAETARKLAGMAIDRNPAKEEIPLEELKVGFDKVFGDDRVIVLDHQGAIRDNRIVDQLEYMCLKGATHLFVDHITILVSEGVENLTGNEAQDKVMNELLGIVKRHPVWIGLVSHLRKAMGGSKSFEEGKLPSIDDIRGSGSIKQISFDIISFARNLTAADEKERNTIKMRVLKSRYTGLTGTVRGARYIYDTGRLTGLDEVIDDSDEFHSI